MIRVNEKARPGVGATGTGEDCEQNNYTFPQPHRQQRLWRARSMARREQLSVRHQYEALIVARARGKRGEADRIELQLRHALPLSPPSRRGQCQAIGEIVTEVMTEAGYREPSEVKHAHDVCSLAASQKGGAA